MGFDEKLEKIEIVRNKVFFDVLPRKVCVINQKNVDFKKSNIWHFSKKASLLFLMKNGKFTPFCFSAR